MSPWQLVRSLKRSMSDLSHFQYDWNKLHFLRNTKHEWKCICFVVFHFSYIQKKIYILLFFVINHWSFPSKEKMFLMILKVFRENTYYFLSSSRWKIWQHDKRKYIEASSFCRIRTIVLYSQKKAQFMIPSLDTD